MGRRRALQVLGIGLGAAAFVGCDWKRKEEGGGGTAGAGGTCESKAPGDENAKQLRKNLQYKEKAVDPAKVCTACIQFEAGKYGDCGGCKLFQGAVNPQGGCLSFAPKQGAPGTPASPPGVAPPPASPPGVAPPAAPAPAPATDTKKG